jgi:tetrachlorobenzoquinone reductase
MSTVTTSSAASAALPEKTSGLISVRLTAVAPVAKDTNLYTFKRVEGGPLPAYRPGAHIDLHLPIGLVRQFSLVVPNTDPEIYVVGVKRDAESRGGSRYIIDDMRVGQEIKVSAPRNHFPLVESGEPVVLIAGGIGITPIWCMTQELAAQDRPWQLYYSCRAREEMAFLETLKTLDPARVHLHLDAEADGKFLDLKAIVAAAPENAHLYCCGPKPMLAAFEAAAAGRPKGHVHVEYFTAKGEEAAATIGGSSWRGPARNITSPRARRSSKCCTRPASTSIIPASSASAAPARRGSFPAFPSTTIQCSARKSRRPMTRS